MFSVTISGMVIILLVTIAPLWTIIYLNKRRKELGENKSRFFINLALASFMIVLSNIFIPALKGFNNAKSGFIGAKIDISNLPIFFNILVFVFILVSFVLFLLRARKDKAKNINF